MCICIFLNDLYFILQKVQDEVLKEYKKMKQVSTAEACYRIIYFVSGQLVDFFLLKSSKSCSQFDG